MNRICLLLLLVVSVCFPELSSSIGGYLENTLSFTTADTGYFSDIPTVRIEGTYEYGDRGSAEVNVIYSSALKPADPFKSVKDNSVTNKIITGMIAQYVYEFQVQQQEQIMQMDSLGQATMMSFASMQQTAITNVIELLEGPSSQYVPYSSFYPKDTFIFDRALISLYFKWCDCTIGTQQIAWGTGYGFNPTDIWNMKSPLDVSAPKKGVHALRAEIPLGSLSGIDLVASPGPDIMHSSGGIRIKSNIDRFDYSFCLVRIMNADRELFGLPKKMMAGVDFAGQILWDIGFWSEIAVTNRLFDVYTNFDSSYAQADIGLDYTFSNGIYILLEYYFNGLGKDEPSAYDISSLIYTFSGEMAGFGRNYLMAGIKYDFLESYTFSLFGIGNMDDRSAAIMPSLDYNFTDNITVQLGTTLFAGDEKESEYGSFYHMINTKVTAYF